MTNGVASPQAASVEPADFLEFADFVDFAKLVNFAEISKLT